MMHPEQYKAPFNDNLSCPCLFLKIAALTAMMKKNILQDILAVSFAD